MSCILITGSQGKIGRVVTRMAVSAGYEIRTLDRAAAAPAQWEHIPGDLLDASVVRRAVMGCDTIVHLGAIPNDRPGPQGDTVYATNVMGTWNVLQAASEVSARRVIFFSSVNALGIWGGQRRADYLPVDDAHPAYPRPAYGLSKHVGEEMCLSFTRRYGFSTYCLRPSFVMEDEQREWRRTRDHDRARRWLVGDYYAAIHVDDVARAVLCCLADEKTAHHGRYLLAAADNGVGESTEKILQEDYPEIEWRGGPDYFDRPDRGLVDTSAAWNDLGWKPERSLRWEE